MKKLFSRSIIFMTTLALLIAGPALATSVADTGLDAANGGTAKPILPTTGDVPTFVGKILGNVLGFTGTIFFVLVIYAGLMWMTAAGNEDQIKKAQKILLAAITGLIIILSAYAITKFIGSALNA